MDFICVMRFGWFCNVSAVALYIVFRLFYIGLHYQVVDGGSREWTYSLFITICLQVEGRWAGRGLLHPDATEKEASFNCIWHAINS